MKKSIKIPLIVIPVLIFVTFIFFSLFINAIVKKSVETLGPNITQTSIDLKKAKISLFSGRGEMQGLIVGNPEDFKTESAYRYRKRTRRS
ncbi:MAG: hypothetical protein MRJ65_07675 [Candidatus Brocadiaceae bacterium]|nr:hypothetical protein [Candidatus Brocadiaceae bacterium]